jgi:hypothetical protein
MEFLHRRIARILAVAVVLLLSQSALAIPIGQFDLIGTVRFDSDELDWSPAGTGTGSATVVVPVSGAFAALADTGATVKDLDFDVQTPGLPFSLDDFLTFVAVPTLSLDLTYIELGQFGSAFCSAAPAAGQICTPTGSPFNFVNLPSGSGLSSILSFVVSGTASDGVSDGPFTAVYTAQFVGLPYQSVLATWGAGGSLTRSYSASFEVVPEPGTLALISAGLGMLALRGRRRT